MNQEYTRNKNIITDMKGNAVFKGKSINEAKRESRRLQGSNLGQGLLRIKV